MLPKKNRLDKKTTELIFRNGKFVHSLYLNLSFLKLDSSLPRISFSVPKNVARKAVQRNLLRRRGYQAAKELLKNLPKGFFGAFVFRKGSPQVFGEKNTNESVDKLTKEISNLIKKI